MDSQSTSGPGAVLSGTSAGPRLPAVVGLGLLLAAAAGVRLWAAGGELWFDELWSLSFARDMTAPWQVLTAIHHDNNHPLNTLAMALAVNIAGAHAAPPLLRLLPLATGIATVALLFWTERRDERGAHAAPWLAATLAAMSFLGITYSSEARGYAPVAFFALAAFACVRHRVVDRPRGRLAFAALSVLGFLSHLTFLFVCAGLVAWTFVQRHDRGWTWRQWIALHQLPLVAMVGIYVIDARRLIYGGGPPFQTSEVITRTLSLLGGGPSTGPGRIAVAAIVVAAVAYGLAAIVRRRRDETAFFATALVFAPIGVLTVYEARYLDVRYFFVLFPFVWLLGGRALAELAAKGPIGRLAAAAAILLSFAGNLTSTVPLLRDGRGHYMDIVTTMARLTPEAVITVGSDQDFRNRLMLTYYAERLPPNRRLVYVPATQWTSSSPEWIVTQDATDHSADPGAHRPPTERYTPVRCVGYGGLSGWTSCVHRLAPRPNDLASRIH